MDSRSGYTDEPLPWLEAVDDEDGASTVSGRKMLAALLMVLAAAVIVAGTFFWLGRQDPVGIAGAPELIRAEPGPYKIKPADPGGLDVAGESETAFQTSAGEDTDAQLDLGAPNAPAVVAPPKEEPKRIPPNETKEPIEDEPAPAAPSGGSGSVIQLGAFKNSAQAERAWTSLAARFPTLSSMNKMVVPFPGGIRLRAGAGSPSDARAACAALKAGGENCFVAN